MYYLYIYMCVCVCIFNLFVYICDIQLHDLRLTCREALINKII